ncbi:MAG: T9SS type A sorting domain-containing protein, partial [Candidatus Marinimicrobia bacterium]|nr:T9SS type A sorting domain-containing protein [Candidatus Neomarinimicrobiota bacterium]
LLDGGMQSVGSHQLSWDASEQPSGIYFYRLLSGNFSQTRKMLLIK